MRHVARILALVLVVGVISTIAILRRDPSLRDFGFPESAEVVNASRTSLLSSEISDQIVLKLKEQEMKAYFREFHEVDVQTFHGIAEYGVIERGEAKMPPGMPIPVKKPWFTPEKIQNGFWIAGLSKKTGTHWWDSDEGLLYYHHWD